MKPKDLPLRDSVAKPREPRTAENGYGYFDLPIGTKVEREPFVPVPCCDYLYWWDNFNNLEPFSYIEGDPARYLEDPQDNTTPF